MTTTQEPTALPAAAQRGRPRTMEDPRGVTVVLDRVHRDLVELYAAQHEINSFGEALRDLIEAHFNIGDQTPAP